MLTILAHRGNLGGPSPTTENRLPTVRDALALGFGIQTDVRRNEDGTFYFSHEAQECVSGLLAEDFCAAFRARPDATIALSVRERGDEDALLAMLRAQGVIDQVFLFDMERIERQAGETARRFRSIHPTIRIAARVSDRGESLERALGVDAASIAWIDEFEGPWCTEQDVRRLKGAGLIVYAVSPDLHRRSFEATRARWLDFIRWGVDGICTDYPTALGRLLAALRHETAA